MMKPKKIINLSSIVFFTLLIHGLFIYILHDSKIISSHRSSHLLSKMEQNKKKHIQQEQLEEFFGEMEEMALVKEEAIDFQNFSEDRLSLQNKSYITPNISKSSKTELQPKLQPLLQNRVVKASAQALDLYSVDAIAPISSNKSFDIQESLDHVFHESEELLDTYAQQQAGSIANSQDFTHRLVFAKDPKTDRLFFQVTLIPKEKSQFKRIRQNLFFLIDRSHSIDRKRYEISKQAVGQALEFLHPEDTFNILVFDDDVIKLYEKARHPTDQVKKEAREFLNQQEYGGLFASTDLYRSLDKIIPEAVAENEINTAVLLSDGETFLTQEEKRQSIFEWTEKNRGKVSLFAAVCGSYNHLPLLDLLTRYNKGALFHCEKIENFSSLLISLMQKIQHPIGKEIQPFLLTDQKQATIYPKSYSLPNLYANQPYRVSGFIEKPQDFYLFLQGRYYGRSLDIQQKVQFTKSSEKSWQSLFKSSHQMQAYEHYYQFLTDGNQKHLKQIKTLLSSFKERQAFE